MRCKGCGSERLVWESGLVTCMDCGLVVGEDMLEDTYPLSYVNVESSVSEKRVKPIRKPDDINGKTVRALAKRALRKGSVMVLSEGSVKLVPYSDYLAEAAVKESEASRIYYKLKKEIGGGRSIRVIAGLALYLHYLSTGMSPSKALKKASRESRASEKSISNAASKYRLVIERILNE
ncbi:MAG: hypothetical protein F7B17_06120 [Desulfurococcales archaeon]|nr:hypothetical protein [Desulfurococcales archaeon]